MHRNLYRELQDWKAIDRRKPILLKGARQVGKTYLLKTFGENEFSRTHYFDFSRDKGIQRVFEGELDPLKIIQRIEILYDIQINLKDDLIVFDEIQECPAAITSLKYFCDDLPSAFVMGSGSFLGVSLSPDSYPVGKIKTMTLYPMSFFEFLKGLEKQTLLDALIQGIAANSIHPTIHEKAFEFLKYYLITGGLPEIVQTFKEKQSDLPTAFKKVRALQAEIIDNYLNDMAKHAGKINAIKIQSVFKNVPVQLAREDRATTKIIFKGVLSTRSNYEQLEDPILWLEKTGLIHKVLICKKAEPPLKAYTDNNRFKLYLFDSGLLGCMAGLEARDIYSYDYGSYKGYFAENFVMQEVASSLQQDIYCWQEGMCEIEFLLSLAGRVVPVEVKAGLNTKAKSLKVFYDRYHPQKSFLVSANPLELKKTGLSFLPLYGVSMLQDVME